ncbi:MAG: PEP-CTERM sorting domain-containing protein [Luteolibacter sp.]
MKRLIFISLIALTCVSHADESDNKVAADFGAYSITPVQHGDDSLTLVPEPNTPAMILSVLGFILLLRNRKG